MNFNPIERWNLALGASAVATSLVVATPAFAMSLAAGAALEAANFRVLHRSAQFVVLDRAAGSRGWMLAFALRFGLLAIGIGAALSLGANAIGLLIGLSLIMPATLVEAWRSRPPVDEKAPALDADDPSWELWNPWLARERDENESGGANS